MKRAAGSSREATRAGPTTAHPRARPRRRRVRSARGNGALAHGVGVVSRRPEIPAA
jgi:hypothetical protein